MFELDEPVLKKLGCFAKNPEDNKDGDEREISDLFVATANCEAVMKFFLMTHPRELVKLTFSQIKVTILKNVRAKKRIIIADQTKFTALKLEAQD